ncbi:MAG: hypothetical protein JWN74_2559 [Acidobacteriaceae bacterium]|nr:hypothetical protein [Acidobacteriaceae bacterium]
MSSEGAVFVPVLERIITGKLLFRAKYLDPLRESKSAVEEPAVPMLDLIAASFSRSAQGTAESHSRLKYSTISCWPQFTSPMNFRRIMPLRSMM